MSTLILRAASIGLVVLPFGVQADCVPVPPPGNALSVEGFYADSRGSVVDAERRKARDRLVAVYESTIRKIQAGADAYALRGEREAGTCALLQLEVWAQAGILTGHLATRQANYERNWYLTGFALAYLKLRDLAAAPEAARIETWLGTLAEGSLAAIDAGEIPGNNLLYWAGLALAATGLATRAPSLEVRGQAILGAGLAAVSPEGRLRIEMERGAKALDYHAFAAGPLVLLAFIADRRGRAFDRPALIRLVEAILAGLEAPSRFAQTTGEEQVLPAEWNLAWLPVYRVLVPGEALPAHAAGSHFLGGDVRSTIAAIVKATAH